MTTVSTNGSQKDTPHDVEQRVLKVIALTKRLPRETVTLDSSFESLGIDSLDRLNILFDLESEFDIEINDEDAKRVENIPQMVAGVLTLVEAKAESAGTSAGLEATRAEAGAAAVPDGEAALEAKSVTKPTSSGE